MRFNLLFQCLVLGCLFPGALAAETLSDLAPTPTSAASLSNPPPIAANQTPPSDPPLEPTLPRLPNAPIELKVQTNRTLGLQDALNIALERSPQLLVARLAVERNEAGVYAAQAGLFPTLSLSSSYTYSQSPQSQIRGLLVSNAFGGNTGTGNFGPAGLASAIGAVETAPVAGVASLSWNVFSSGLIPSRIRAAEQTVAASRFDYGRIRQEVLSSVITAYYGLQQAEGNLAIGEASVRSAEATLKDSLDKERIGLGTRFTALQAEVQLINARQELLRYQNERTVKQRTLARVLNFAKPTDARADDPIERTSRWEQTLEETILKAYNQRQELGQQLSLEQVARAQEESAYASTSPQLNLLASAQIYDDLLDNVQGLFTGYSAGAQILWNAFDGGLAAAQAAQAAVDAKTARVRFQDSLNTVRLDVETYYSQMETADQRVEATRKAVTSAEEALRLSRLRFKAGVGTQTDVLIADRDLTQARVNRLSAIVDYNQAIALLKRAQGSL